MDVSPISTSQTKPPVYKAEMDMVGSIDGLDWVPLGHWYDGLGRIGSSKFGPMSISVTKGNIVNVKNRNHQRIVVKSDWIYLHKSYILNFGDLFIDQGKFHTRDCSSPTNFILIGASYRTWATINRRFDYS